MLGKETNEKVKIISMKIEVEEHILRVNNAIHALQLNLDRLIDGVMNEQKGVIQPQMVSPTTLIEVLIVFPPFLNIPLYPFL
jgi:hypothetical protein